MTTIVAEAISDQKVAVRIDDQLFTLTVTEAMRFRNALDQAVNHVCMEHVEALIAKRSL